MIIMIFPETKNHQKSSNIIKNHQTSSHPICFPSSSAWRQAPSIRSPQPLQLRMPPQHLPASLRVPHRGRRGRGRQGGDGGDG
jgi:hypothetical protein